MKKILAFLVTFIAFGMVAGAVHADSNIYRLYNPNTGEHFYTSSSVEKSGLLNVGWIYEGIGWVAPSAGSPVYRLYNPHAMGGDHYYTTSAGERDVLMRAGWHYDGVFWRSGGKVSVYVAYNPNAQSGAHNFTTNASEQQSLLNVGWKFPAVAWQAVKLGSANGGVQMRPQTGDYWNYPSELNAYPNINQYPGINIVVNKATQRLYIKSNNRVLYTMYCSTANPALGATPSGSYAVQAEHGATLVENGYAVAKTYTSWYQHGIYLFHSVVFNPNGTVDIAQAEQLGKTPQSHGCVRLTIPDARWIYQTIPVGTPVTIQ
ncbi:L,D-transpeptidase family protein [Lactococcus nasutitermitis]|uniref:L,D-transpeptidase family protein n=1 Tax=Lactococcus nasutitermitis TaxID=1652957 RepID=A0ABV9JDY1_9LACT|nr:L,D-transpeptidase family protein [Lactococcus nasutitermitis]